MAVWQFSVVLIPRAWAIERQYDPASLYSAEGCYETGAAWRAHQPRADFAGVLSGLLPPAGSWYEELQCWGNDKENDIQVWYDEGAVEGIAIRLDARQPLRQLIAGVVQAARALDCVLFFPEARAMVEASEPGLEQALRQSRAARFVSAPRAFLEGESPDGLQRET